MWPTIYRRTWLCTEMTYYIKYDFFLLVQIICIAAIYIYTVCTMLSWCMSKRWAEIKGVLFSYKNQLKMTCIAYKLAQATIQTQFHKLLKQRKKRKQIFRNYFYATTTKKIKKIIESIVIKSDLTDQKPLSFLCRWTCVLRGRLRYSRSKN